MDLSTDTAPDGDVERLVEGIHCEAIEGMPGEAMSQPLICFIALNIWSCKRGQEYDINRSESSGSSF